MKFCVAAIVVMVIALTFVVGEVSAGLTPTSTKCYKDDGGEWLVDDSGPYDTCWKWCSAYYKLGGYCLDTNYCACN